MRPLSALNVIVNVIVFLLLIGFAYAGQPQYCIDDSDCREGGKCMWGHCAYSNAPQIGGQDESFCGDGVCFIRGGAAPPGTPESESCVTCPQDCICPIGAVCDPSNPAANIKGCVLPPVEQCETHFDCYAGEKCEAGQCVPLEPGKCFVSEDCEVTAPEISNAVCQKGECVLGQEYHYSLAVDTEKRDFYMNGLNAVKLVFTLKKFVDNEWVPAVGEEVQWILTCDYQSCTDIGELVETDFETDSRGKAEAKYIMPFVSANNVQWLGRNHQTAIVDAMHVKDSEVKGVARERFNLYPPIYVKSIEIAPKIIQEQSPKAVVVVELFNRKKATVFLEARSKRDWLYSENESKEKTHEYFTTIQPGQNKIKLYVEVEKGIRSLDFDEMPEWEVAEEAIRESIKNSVGKADLIFIGINTGFSLSKYGKAADEFAEQVGKEYSEAGELVLKHAVAPGNAGVDFLTTLNWAKTAQRIGKSRGLEEGFWNSTALVVESMALCVGVLSGKMSFGENLLDTASGAGKDLVLTAIFNSASSWFKETADMVRIANAESVLYPRVIKVKVVDEDKYETQAYVPYYIERYE